MRVLSATEKKEREREREREREKPALTNQLMRFSSNPSFSLLRPAPVLPAEASHVYLL
jgi:hypothetical protein